MMKEMPSVTSTWPCSLPASLRRMKRSISDAEQPDAEPADDRRQPEIADEPQQACSRNRRPSMKNAPCARLGMRIRPKISEKPDDSRNSRPPKATLFSVWMIQNCHCIEAIHACRGRPHGVGSMRHQPGLHRVRNVQPRQRLRDACVRLVLANAASPEHGGLITARDSWPAGSRANRPDSSGTRLACRSRTGSTSG